MQQRSRRELQRSLVNRLAGGLIRLFVERGVSPFHLTYSSFTLSIISAVFYALTQASILFAVYGGVSWLISGFLDAIDGEVARLSSKTSKQGAYLDSMFDKAGEALVCIGILLSGIVDGVAVLLFCATSLLVSYARARAEGVGVSLKGVGIAERAERIILISAASLITPLYPASLNIALYFGAALASITVAWRTIHVIGSLRGERSSPEA
ncbi:CDP-diacylglycerol--inositol 3-phosphatidyltransferase [Candidatus Calditenuaceae archaeon HR02]|nr:CDP-diacylglycerol--inositol 3-phosphatidyltransferase [Candidatus Calditenuaceae archaeon HR02]